MVSPLSRSEPVKTPSGRLGSPRLALESQPTKPALHMNGRPSGFLLETIVPVPVKNGKPVEVKLPSNGFINPKDPKVIFDAATVGFNTGKIKQGNQARITTGRTINVDGGSPRGNVRIGGRGGVNAVNTFGNLTLATSTFSVTNTRGAGNILTEGSNVYSANLGSVNLTSSATFRNTYTNGSINTKGSGIPQFDNPRGITRVGGQDIGAMAMAVAHQATSERFDPTEPQAYFSIPFVQHAMDSVKLGSAPAVHNHLSAQMAHHLREETRAGFAYSSVRRRKVEEPHPH